MKMTELCAEERPREKLLSLGPDALSTGELLAIIIKCGTGDASALEVAQKLLSSAGGSLGAVYAMGEAQMRAIPGIGPCKAAEILASTSLTIRMIAVECGFYDEYYFSNYFKKYYRISPSEYRKSTR